MGMYVKVAKDLDLTWQKSSYSNAESNCVEIASFAEDMAVRDSKDPAGPALVFRPEAWCAFLAGVRTGSFPAGA
ncbi:DUF397 domain-containing protein [Kitasatospora sp. LaBMicrA B282]|uniref:DUF397 domain-containing protein n=1 Tax=Kitasatospora sp. LaBMicrA B282 TaxID=3420949 RepID=UPI003D152345